MDMAITIDSPHIFFKLKVREIVVIDFIYQVVYGGHDINFTGIWEKCQLSVIIMLVDIIRCRNFICNALAIPTGLEPAASTVTG